MTKKYIIRNCPNLQESYYADGHISKNECSLDIYDKQCSDCTDCLIKQVVDKCREPEQVYRSYEKPLTQTQCNTLFGRMTLGNEILQIFTIEEVE